MALTTQQVVGGVAAGAGAVAVVLQAVKDPSEAVEVVALLCTAVAAGGNAFIAYVSTPVKLIRQMGTKHTETMRAWWNGRLD